MHLLQMTSCRGRKKGEIFVPMTDCSYLNTFRTLGTPVSPYFRLGPVNNALDVNYLPTLRGLDKEVKSTPIVLSDSQQYFSVLSYISSCAGDFCLTGLKLQTVTVSNRHTGTDSKTWKNPELQEWAFSTHGNRGWCIPITLLNYLLKCTSWVLPHFYRYPSYLRL